MTPAPALNEQDLKNLLLILQRASVTGVEEAKALVVLAAKLQGMLLKLRDADGG